MPPPKLEGFPPWVHVPNPSQLQKPAGAIRRRGMRAHQRRPLTRCRLDWTWHCRKGSFLWANQTAAEGFLRSTHAKPSDVRKKPMSVLPMASPPSEDWKDRKHRFLSDTYGDLCKSWKSYSMAWTNLHVAAYFHDLPGLTHPRQLASCALRSDSNSEFRWSCWACQLNPEEARLSGFSPSKSCWHNDAQQLYH